MVIDSLVMMKCFSPGYELIVMKYDGKIDGTRPILNKDCWIFRKLPQEHIALLNSDPDIYCYNAATEVLEDSYDILSFLYSNSDGAGVTDHVFDTIEYYIRKRYKAMARKFDKVGAEPINKQSIALPFQMGSLEKIKPDYKEFFPYLSGSEKIFASEKLDGVSALWYKNKLYTRGNGVIGNDISELAPYIKGLIVAAEPIRGELVIKKAAFTKWSNLYTNPRNLVSGKINSKSLSEKDIETLKDIEFLAYELINSSMSPQDQYDHLQSFGFSTPDHFLLTTPTSFSVVNLYQTRRSNSEYPIDGLVLQYAKRNSSDTKIAFKMLLEEQIRSTTINNIEWRISKYGRYVPVALYDTVYIEGNRYHKALAFNADWVRSRSLGVGTKIRISRSGDVIPQIIHVDIDPTIRPILPSQKYAWKWQGKDIVLEDVENNKEVKIGRLVHFFETLGVPRLREATLTKFYESGMDNLSKIVNSSIADFAKIKGVGPKLSKTFYESIHSTFQTIRIDRLMIASGLFKGLGNKLLRVLYRSLPKIAKGKITVEEVQKVEGFGGKRAETVIESSLHFQELIKSLGRDEIMQGYDHDQLRRAKYRKDHFYPIFAGKNIIFTGFLGNIDLDIEDFIWDHDAQVGSKVTSDTLCVICYSLSSVSQKMKDASEKNIPVYTLDEFRAKYGLKKSEGDEFSTND